MTRRPSPVADLLVNLVFLVVSAACAVWSWWMRTGPERTFCQQSESHPLVGICVGLPTHLMYSIAAIAAAFMAAFCLFQIVCHALALLRSSRSASQKLTNPTDPKEQP